MPATMSHPAGMPRGEGAAFPTFGETGVGVACAGEVAWAVGVATVGVAVGGAWVAAAVAVAVAVAGVAVAVLAGVGVEVGSGSVVVVPAGWVTVCSTVGVSCVAVDSTVGVWPVVVGWSGRAARAGCATLAVVARPRMATNNPPITPACSTALLETFTCNSPNLWYCQAHNWSRW